MRLDLPPTKTPATTDECILQTISHRVMQIACCRIDVGVRAILLLVLLLVSAWSLKPEAS
jgi:hypothetical protein